MVGNNVSHALNRTKRKFKVNLLKKRFYLPEEDRWVVLKISANALKTINKKGIDAVLQSMAPSPLRDEIIGFIQSSDKGVIRGMI